VSQRWGEPDRQPFSLVSEAAFENLFGARRSHLDAAISETGEGDPPYGHRQNYVEVARITGLDRRTVKKHVARRTACE
jgi:hypothetical protein